ncbi:MAG: hypothetical protein WC960_04025 [Bacteroidales bacterium]
MEKSLNDTILIGDQRTLTFGAKIGKGERLQFLSPSKIVEGVELVGEPSLDTTLLGGDSLQLQSQFIITSFDSGSYRLPKFQALLFREGGGVDTLTFDTGTLEVRTIEIDTTTYRPFDLKGQIEYPVTVKEVLTYVGVGALLVATLYFLYRAIKRVRSKRGLFTKKRESEPAHIVALRELEKLREGKLWLDDQKLFFTHLADILRLYIQERYSFPTMESTSAEILEQLLSEKIEPELFKELSSLFSLSDLVKFAKYIAHPAECEESLPVAIKFINSSYIAQIEENREQLPNNSE